MSRRERGLERESKKEEWKEGEGYPKSPPHNFFGPFILSQFFLGLSSRGQILPCADCPPSIRPSTYCGELPITWIFV